MATCTASLLIAVAILTLRCSLQLFMCLVPASIRMCLLQALYSLPAAADAVVMNVSAQPSAASAAGAAGRHLLQDAFSSLLFGPRRFGHVPSSGTQRPITSQPSRSELLDALRSGRPAAELGSEAMQVKWQQLQLSLPPSGANAAPFEFFLTLWSAWLLDQLGCMSGSHVPTLI